MIRVVGSTLLVAIALSAQVPANLPPFSTFLKANSRIMQVKPTLGATSISTAKQT